MATRLDIAIEPVPVDAAPAIVALIERVVLESVEATDAEKQAFLANIRANLDQWVQSLRLNAAKNAVAFYERMGWRRIVEAVPAHSATRFELLL